MRKIILIGILSLISSVYAMEVVTTDKVKEEVTQAVKEIESVKVNNNTFLYEFDFGSVGQLDKGVHKYMTNNLDSVATVDSLREVMFKNWKLGKEYSKNIAFKSSKTEGEKLVCKYNNGLVIKVKNYGDYDKNCPLKD